MSKSGKDTESRTVANSPLQQSSFVYFPEEETIRKKMLENPRLFSEGAEQAMANYQAELCARGEKLWGYVQASVQAANNIAGLAGNFAKRLPQSVFGTGNGTEFLLPLGILFERVQQNESELNLLLVGLEELTLPDRFDPARFAFFESVIPTAKVAARAEALAKQGNDLRQTAKTLFEGVDAFCQTVTNPFFTKTAKAADLEHDGRGMYFGRLASLCGELESVARQRAGEWSRLLATVAELEKGNLKP